MRSITKHINFRLVDTIDDALRLDILNEIERANLWLWHTGRQKLYEQSETQTIPLRGPAPEIDYTGPGHGVHASCDILIHKFPIVKSLLQRYQPISRAMIVRLAPWGQVYKHFDYGAYYERRDRFHLILKSEGSDLTSGDEAVTMHQGELWWFNNDLPHQAFNFSDDWRIHIIFDSETSTYKKQEEVM